jgi:PAS domain S-box-containing protein
VTRQLSSRPLRRARREALPALDTLEWRAVLDAVDDPVLVHDAATGDILEANRAACELYGWSREELRALAVADLSRGTPPYTQADAAAWVRRAAAEGPQRFEWVARHRDGRHFWAEVSLRRVDVGGRPRVVASVRDVTARKGAEASLRVSEARYQNAFREAGIGMAMCAPDGRFLQVNRALCEMLSYREGALDGVSVLEVTHPEDREASRELLERLLGGELDSYRVEKRYLTRHGQTRWGSVVVTLVRDDAGAPLHTVSQIQDITESRRIREALRESEAKYRTLLETTGTGFVIADRNGRILDANAEYVRLTGHRTLAEIRGRSALEWTAPHDRERNAAAIAQCVSQGRLRNFSVDYVDAQGRLTPLDINASTLETPQGLRILGLCQDVSQRRAEEEARAALERELHRSHALEAVGRLAGGVAHDFNNILGSILGSVYVARMEWGREGSAAAELGRIETLCKRGGELTRQLLTVARRPPGQDEVLDVARQVGEVRQLLEHTLPRDIRLEVESEEGLPSVRADRAGITTVLLNLALNARDAMPAGGLLQVRARRQREKSGEDWVHLEVADSGPGIPEHLRGRLFEPFVSTKAVGMGLGLGLSTARAAVRGWGGDLRVDSAPGRGSTFTVRLPAWSGDRGGESAKDRAHPLTAAPLLVVEDEEGVARLMTLTLEAQGYATVQASTGIEALERLRERRGAFGLVILDLVLPELRGEQVYRVLRGLAPEVPVLVVSGREDLARALAPGGPTLIKPFSAEEFLDAVSRALLSGA